MYVEYSRLIGESVARAHQLAGPQVLASAMFARFFECYPEAGGIYADTDVAGFGPTKFRIVCELILDVVRHPDYAVDNMACEVLRHRYYDVRDVAYYYALMDACRDSIQQVLGGEWTQALNDCWNDVIQAARATLQLAMREAARMNGERVE